MRLCELTARALTAVKQFHTGHPKRMFSLNLITRPTAPLSMAWVSELEGSEFQTMFISHVNATKKVSVGEELLANY